MQLRYPDKFGVHFYGNVDAFIMSVSTLTVLRLITSRNKDGTGLEKIIRPLPLLMVWLAISVAKIGAMLLTLASVIEAISCGLVICFLIVDDRKASHSG